MVQLLPKLMHILPGRGGGALGRSMMPVVSFRNYRKQVVPVLQRHRRLVQQQTSTPTHPLEEHCTQKSLQQLLQVLWVQNKRKERERERERMAAARTTTHILGDWRIREETLGWSSRIWCCEDGHNTITTLFLLLLSMSMSSSSSSLLTTELGVAQRIPELRVHHSLLLTQHQKRSRQHFPAPLESSLSTASLLSTAAYPRSLPAPAQQTSMS